MAPSSLLLVAVTVVEVAASPYSASGLMLPGPFADYLCQPVLADRAKHMWAWDFSAVSHIVNGSGKSGAYTFTYAVCGVSSIGCTPHAGDAVLQPYSPATQVFGGNPPGGECPNPATGGTSPCSTVCKPAAQGAPSWQLLNASDATAGVALTFAGVKPAPGDASTCGGDPVTGAQLPRTAIIAHVCDRSVPRGAVAFVTADEGPTCVYTITLRSVHACPTPTDEAYPVPPPGPVVPPMFVNDRFAPYFTHPVFPIGGGGALSWDLSMLWTKGVDYSFTNTTTGFKYAFQIAGTGATVCAPKNFLPTANMGTAVVFTGSTTPGGLCPLSNGTLVPCTPDCHVLAVGAPIISVADPNNPGRGGLLLEWDGVVLNADEGGACGRDPVTGIPLPTRLIADIKCNDDPVLTVLSVVEDACTTTITVAVLDACTE